MINALQRPCTWHNVGNGYEKLLAIEIGGKKTKHDVRKITIV